MQRSDQEKQPIIFSAASRRDACGVASVDVDGDNGKPPKNQFLPKNSSTKSSSSNIKTTGVIPKGSYHSLFSVTEYVGRVTGQAGAGQFMNLHRNL